MSEEFQIKINLYWDCDIKRDVRGPYFDGGVKKHWTVRRRITLEELSRKIYATRRLDRNRDHLKLNLRVPTMYGSGMEVQWEIYELNDDEDMDLIWNLPSKNRDLSNLMYSAGAEPNEAKFTAIMDEIKRRSQAAFDWLNAIDRETWTLAYDNGYRHGCLTTNLSESLNSVLKKGRSLPIKALVEMTVVKLVKYFSDHREQAAHNRHPFAPRIWKKFSDNEKKSRTHTVVQYNSQLGLFSVKSIPRGDGRGNKIYTIKMSEKSCSCHKWSVFGIPCSHAFAVCRHRGWQPGDLVNEVYSKERYRKAYMGNFFPVPNDSFWRPSSFNLIHYKPNMKGNSSGRIQSARIRSDADYRHPDSPRRCGNCHRAGHNRRNCPGHREDESST